MKTRINNLITWIRTHKAAAILIFVVIYFVYRQLTGMVGFSISRMPAWESTNPSFETASKEAYSLGAPAGLSLSGRSADYYQPPVMQQEYTPTYSTDRMVVQNSYLSLLVKNVSDSVQMIKKHAESNGGYMVDANVNNPLEAANGTITIRIPSQYIDATLAYFHQLAVKVVSENLQGTDVTDQYQDIEERLRILERNKSRMEELMERAVEISDIIRIQQEIFNLQSQIDSLTGQQQYLQQTSRLAKITVYLSTDELALPYAPEHSWRPAVIFKYAVRSLLANVQKLATLIIWIAVYAVIWIPLVLLYKMWRKRSSGTKKTSTFKLQ